MNRDSFYVCSKLTKVKVSNEPSKSQDKFVHEWNKIERMTKTTKD